MQKATSVALAGTSWHYQVFDVDFRYKIRKHSTINYILTAGRRHLIQDRKATGRTENAYKHCKQRKQHVWRRVARTSRELEELDLAPAKVLTCQDPTSNSDGTAEGGKAAERWPAQRTETQEAVLERSSRRTSRRPPATVHHEAVSAADKAKGVAEPGRNLGRQQRSLKWSNSMATGGPERHSRAHRERGWTFQMSSHLSNQHCRRLEWMHNGHHFTRERWREGWDEASEEGEPQKTGTGGRRAKESPEHKST